MPKETKRPHPNLGRGLFLFSFRFLFSQGTFAKPLFYGLGEQVFDLPVHRAEVVLRPGGELCVKLRRQAQGDLLF